MTGIASLFALLPLVLLVLIVWQVISSLNEISRGVADISMTLRRIESRGSQGRGSSTRRTCCTTRDLLVMWAPMRILFWLS